MQVNAPRSLTFSTRIEVLIVLRIIKRCKQSVVEKTKIIDMIGASCRIPPTNDQDVDVPADVLGNLARSQVWCAALRRSGSSVSSYIVSLPGLAVPLLSYTGNTLSGLWHDAGHAISF